MSDFVDLTTERRLPPTANPVNHPAHYGGGDNPYEVIKVINAWGLDFSLGNCVKYIARAGKKSVATLIEDLKKARFYLDNKIAVLEAAETPKSTYTYTPPEPGYNPCSNFPGCGCPHIGQGSCNGGLTPRKRVTL